MKLGVFNPVLGGMQLEDALKYLHGLGVEMIELGAGGHPGKDHIDPDVLLEDDRKIEDIKALLKKYQIEVAAISCHGNPVHPQKEVAQKFHDEFEKAVLFAEKMGVDTMIGFSGCPGDSEGSKYPNWVTCPWPEDYPKILDYQWNEVLIPYWKKEAEFCKNHGIKKIAFEMHPNFCVYNPETCMRLREAVGDIIGANVDPSHFFWQGINPVTAIKYLGEKNAIYHFHAKDTKIDERNTGLNGVLDTKPYTDLLNRSWLFRTVGYGHGKDVWREIISMLKTVGYDGVVSIEHEDALMSPTEGLEKAVRFLQDILIRENADRIWWA